MGKSGLTTLLEGPNKHGEYRLCAIQKLSHLEERANDGVY